MDFSFSFERYPSRPTEAPVLEADVQEDTEGLLRIFEAEVACCGTDREILTCREQVEDLGLRRLDGLAPVLHELRKLGVEEITVGRGEFVHDVEDEPEHCDGDTDQRPRERTEHVFLGHGLFLHERSLC